MGPDGSHNFDVYLRTAVSVDPQGWAQFGHVKMPDYRWGIFLNPARRTARSTSATTRARRLAGRARRAPRQPAPHHRHAGRHRAGVGGAAAPPGPDRAVQYDLRNLFQVNVEEGRHLWAMVYLLHKHFGRDGREEGEALLERRSGERTTRASWAFNERRRTGCRSSCSPTSPTATASSSSARWPSRLRPAGAHHQVHADRRKRTTCSSASPASAA
jgi:benzoyl-CoA 2,3-dioxygenase component B